MDFSERLHAAVHDAPDRPMIEQNGRVFTAGDLASWGDAVVALIDAAVVPHAACIGIVLRNRPAHAAAVQGLVAARRPVTTVYAMQSGGAIAADFRETRLAAMVADRQDWTDDLVAVARDLGAVAIAIDSVGHPPVAIVAGLDRAGDGPFRIVGAEAGIELLSSGTTGKPKRLLFPYRMLVRAIESISFGRGTSAQSADVATLPFTGIGGLCGLVASPIVGRYTALLEKFNVAEFVDAVRRLRPTVLSGPPTIPRMLIDAALDPADLSSVRYWYGGGAPFPPELQDEFEAAYGIRTIWAYGATEFCGTAISWTPELDAQYREAKRGSSGRLLPGISARIIDPQTCAEAAPGAIGFLELRIPLLGDVWISTNDLMRFDEDGFAWHHGRGDGAINRGGFKILPEKIVEALLLHPAVLDASVIGMADRRLGAVPIAAVELRRGIDRPDEATLRDHVRAHLPSNHLPARIVAVDALPRTASLKVDLIALKRLLDTESTMV